MNIIVAAVKITGCLRPDLGYTDAVTVYIPFKVIDHTIILVFIQLLMLFNRFTATDV